jgi:hypothetical protein
MLHRFALHYFSYLHKWGDQERCTNSRKDDIGDKFKGQMLTVQAHGHLVSNLHHSTQFQHMDLDLTSSD